MKVVVINGGAEVGKDKFVSFFKKISKDFRIKNYSSIDRVKQISEICFGWDGKKDGKSRKLLSEMKRIWTDFNDGPFDIITNQITTDIKWSKNKGKNISKNIYFLHIREPKEISKIKKFYGFDCITLLVKKDVDFTPDNYSDKNVENFDYDYIVDNNKSEDELTKRAEEFYEFIKKPCNFLQGFLLNWRLSF